MIGRLLLCLNLFLCGLFIIPAPMAWATTRYVSQGGHGETSVSDSNNCATSTNILFPKLTFASAIGCLAAGDTLYVRAGTWPVALNLSGISGAAGNFITVAAYPGDPVGSVIIQPSLAGGAVYGTRSTNGYIVIDGFVWDGINAPADTGLNVDHGAHDWTFQNLEIKNWFYNGILLGTTVLPCPCAASNIKVLHNIIHDQIGLDFAPHRYYGIYFDSCDNCEVAYNDIYNNPGGGMQVYPGPSANALIHHNKFHHNDSLSSSNVGGLLIASNTTNLRVYDNLIYYNGTGTAINAPGIYLFGSVTGAKIWNNAVVGNLTQGIFIESSSASSNTLQNNISYLNQGNAIEDHGTGTVKDHNLTTDPNFVNLATFDFHLNSGSAAIDTGADLSAFFTTDFADVPRPQGSAYDIGAYEFGVSVSPPKFAPGRNLRRN